MDPEFYKEWHRLEDEAREMLERRPTRNGLRPECHAVVLPSFEDCSAYTLMVPGFNSPGAPHGVKRVWRRRSDLAKFNGPVIRLRYGTKLEPTIEEHEVPLSPESVSEILVRAADIRVPARIPVNGVGTDGVTHVLHFGELFLASRFEWWGDPPSGWEALKELLEMTASVVEGGLTGR